MMPKAQLHQASSDSNQNTLLLSKLRPPRPASALIERPALLSLLDRGLACALTLLSAPAGFGKTTLLAQWVQAIDHPNAWLSLDKRDNDLPTFVHSLATALQTAFPDAFAAIAAMRNAQRSLPPENIVTVLSNDKDPVVRIPAEEKSGNAPLIIKRALYGPVPTEHTGWLIAACLGLFIACYSVGPGVVVWLIPAAGHAEGGQMRRDDAGPR